MSEDTQLATTKRSEPVPVKDGVLDIKNTDDMWRFASIIARSKLAPDTYNSVEKIMVGIQYGAELGLKPMQALQNIAVINGRPAIYGKAIAGVVTATGQLEEFSEWTEGEGDDHRAICKIKRKGVLNEVIKAFSVGDAKRAGLWGKGNTWTKYPKDMLTYKARARAFSTLFGDVLCGIPCVEDVREVYESKASPIKEVAAPTPDPLLSQIGVVQEGEKSDG